MEEENHSNSNTFPQPRSRSNRGFASNCGYNAGGGSSSLPPIYRTNPPITAFRSAMKCEANEKKHRRHVAEAVETFRRYQSREEEAYKRIAVKQKWKIPGLGHKVKDHGVIETILDGRNQEWRRRVEDGGDPYLSRPSITDHEKLPREKIRQRPKPPVLYWGCGQFK